MLHRSDVQGGGGAGRGGGPDIHRMSEWDWISKAKKYRKTTIVEAVGDTQLTSFIGVVLGHPQESARNCSAVKWVSSKKATYCSLTERGDF